MQTYRLVQGENLITMSTALQVPVGTTDRQERSVKSDRLSPSERDLIAIRHDIDLLLHS